MSIITQAFKTLVANDVVFARGIEHCLDMFYRVYALSFLDTEIYTLVLQNWLEQEKENFDFCQVLEKIDTFSMWKQYVKNTVADEIYQVLACSEDLKQIFKTAQKGKKQKKLRIYSPTGFIPYFDILQKHCSRYFTYTRLNYFFGINSRKNTPVACWREIEVFLKSINKSKLQPEDKSRVRSYWILARFADTCKKLSFMEMERWIELREQMILHYTTQRLDKVDIQTSFARKFTKIPEELGTFSAVDQIVKTFGLKLSYSQEKVDFLRALLVLDADLICKYNPELDLAKFIEQVLNTLFEQGISQAQQKIDQIFKN